MNKTILFTAASMAALLCTVSASAQPDKAAAVFRDRTYTYRELDELTDRLAARLYRYAYYRLGKWCCYYTIHHVFRPALEKAGYSPAQINHIAPNSYDSKRLANGLLVAKTPTLLLPPRRGGRTVGDHSSRSAR